MRLADRHVDQHGRLDPEQPLARSLAGERQRIARRDHERFRREIAFLFDLVRKYSVVEQVRIERIRVEDVEHRLTDEPQLRRSQP